MSSIERLEALEQSLIKDLNSWAPSIDEEAGWYIKELMSLIKDIVSENGLKS